MSSSRIPAFYELTVEERRRKLAQVLDLTAEEMAVLSSPDALPFEIADTMVENAVGTFALPFGEPRFMRTYEAFERAAYAA